MSDCRVEAFDDSTPGLDPSVTDAIFMASFIWSFAEAQRGSHKLSKSVSLSENCHPFKHLSSAVSREMGFPWWRDADGKPV